MRDVLRRRFARLPEITVSVLRLAAVIGRDVDIDVLVRAAEVDEETVLDALEAGVLAGLLTEPAPAPCGSRTCWSATRCTTTRPGCGESRWHARVAAALAEIRPGDARRAGVPLPPGRHRSDRPQAVDAGVRAADQAVARYAHETAAELYAQALADLDRVPDADLGADSADRGPGGRTGGTAGAAEPLTAGRRRGHRRERSPGRAPWRWPTGPAGSTC